MGGWALLWVSCALALRAPAPRPPHRDVATGAGTARGYLVPRPPHYAFLGLPYARPVESFKSAAEVRWDGVLEATHRVRCEQPGRRRDPACLVLNVFVPERAAAARPVLVHLHAGHFATGWGSHTAPPGLLSLGVIVVTLNYRLGADGFLCLRTRDAPGNTGLKDQAAAIAWVHANIDKFGGDPSQVTLYGTGAGAAAAELLLLSGAIDGFIQRVIMESGSALAPTSLSTDPVATALEVAMTLGYEDDESKTIDDLTKFYQDIAIAKTLNFSNRFAPCVENIAEYYSALLIKDPKEILQSGILKPVPLMIVYSKERSLDDDDLLHNLPSNFEDLLPNNLEFNNEDIKFKIGEQVKESYFGELETGVGVIERFESYANDVFTVYPTVKSATLHAAASSSPVYLMEFLPRDDSNTIYEYIFSKDVFTGEEEIIAEKLVTMWSNFIMYSDPTPLETSLLPVVWLPVTFRVKNEKPDISTASCLVFDLGHVSMTMGTPPSGHTLPIWDHIYDNFYKSHTPTLEISEKEIAMYSEDLAFISTLSRQGSGTEGENYEDGHIRYDGARNKKNMNDGEEDDKNDSDGNEYISNEGNNGEVSSGGNESDGNEYISNEGNNGEVSSGGNESDGNEYISNEGNNGEVSSGGNESDGNEYISNEGNNGEVSSGGNESDGNEYISNEGNNGEVSSGGNESDGNGSNDEIEIIDEDNSGKQNADVGEESNSEDGKDNKGQQEYVEVEVTN